MPLLALMGQRPPITWTTDELANWRVDYGTDPDALTQSVTDGALATSHSLPLTGLTPSTTYYYRVTSADAADNTTTSPAPESEAPANFVSGAPDTTAPVISSVSAVPGANGNATITWSTDELSTSRVDYGTTSDALTLNESAAGLVTSHSLALTGLSPDTTYYYRVTSADAANNSSSSRLHLQLPRSPHHRPASPTRPSPISAPGHSTVVLQMRPLVMEPCDSPRYLMNISLVRPCLSGGPITSGTAAIHQPSAADS